jgi:Flp pilus assembly pilin Flp
MEFTSRLYVRARETVVGAWRGQTYTEYALVLLFAVIVMITGYQKMGIHIRNAVAGLADSVADA